MGGSTSGKRVNERTAMQMTAVYSCVRILSEAVASLPLQFYRYTDDGGKEKAVEHPLYFLLHDEPNPEMTSFVFRETLMTHLLLWGNAYAQIIRNGRGEVVALYPLMADRMYVDRDDKGQLYYEYTLYSDDAPTMKGSIVRLSPYEVLHIPGLGFDGLVGYSPIAMAKNAIGMAMACEEYGAKFFANGAAPSGVLEHPGTIKDPSRVRESWQRTFGGSGNANKVAVLEEGMKYTPISISPEQAQFLETRKFQLDEIARIFRVPYDRGPGKVVFQQHRAAVPGIREIYPGSLGVPVGAVHGALAAVQGREIKVFHQVQRGRTAQRGLPEPDERICHGKAERLDERQRYPGTGKPGPDPGGAGRGSVPDQREHDEACGCRAVWNRPAGDACRGR